MLNRVWNEAWENYLSLSKGLPLVAPNVCNVYINDFDKDIHGVPITYITLNDTKNTLCEIIRILKRTQPIGTMWSI